MIEHPIAVEQGDRDAVQAFHRTMLDRLMSEVKSQRPKMGGDEGDAGTLVQAFARHRLAERERCAEVEAALNQIADLGSCASGKTPAHKLFQRAIDIATGAL